MLFAYRPPQNNIFKTLFEKMNLSLSTIKNRYDNIMIIWDLNLNPKSKNSSYYSDLFDTFESKFNSNLHWHYINKSAKKFSKFWSNYHRAQLQSKNDLAFRLLLLIQITN